MWHWKQKATQKAKYEVQAERDPRFAKSAPSTFLHPEAETQVTLLACIYTLSQCGRTCTTRFTTTNVQIDQNILVI